MCVDGVVGDVVPIYMPACLMILLWSSDWRGGDGGDVPQPVLTFTRQHQQQHSTTLHNTTNTSQTRLHQQLCNLRNLPRLITWATLRVNFRSEFAFLLKQIDIFIGLPLICRLLFHISPSEPPMPMIELGAGGGCDRLT